MALNINGRIKVKTLKSDFKNEDIIIYASKELQDDEEIFTIAKNS